MKLKYGAMLKASESFLAVGEIGHVDSHHTKKLQELPRGPFTGGALMLFLDSVPVQMRDYSFPTDGTLQGNGSNLSAVLYNLWGHGKLAGAERIKDNRKTILAFIQSLPEQDISGVSFLEEPRGGVMVKLTETFGGLSKDYDASLLSDGRADLQPGTE